MKPIYTTNSVATVTIVSDYPHLPPVAFALSGSHEESKQKWTKAPHVHVHTYSTVAIKNEVQIHVLIIRTSNSRGI